MHGVWGQLLDHDFVQSYCHGFTMECLDGIWRRFYPWIFTYSADYPEKYALMHWHHHVTDMVCYIRVLLSNVRNNGDCPCPWCLVAKSDIHKMVQVLDIRNRLSRARSYMGDVIHRARYFIYNLGKNVASATVERLLFERSWVPTLVCHHMLVLLWCAQLPHRIFLRRNLGHLGLIHS